LSLLFARWRALRIFLLLARQSCARGPGSRGSRGRDV
jgi:hypothetical protein